MSVTIPNLNDFIDRIALILEKNTTLFPTETTGKRLVNKILKYNPAIATAPDTTFLPYIFITKSNGQPIRQVQKAGRDTIDKAGATLYELEFYCVICTQAEEISIAQKGAYDIAVPVQQAFEQNLRLIDPITNDNPLCRRVTTFMIPYLFKLNVPSIQAVNVVVRPEVYVNLR